MTKAQVFVNRGYQISNTERLSNKTKQQVSCCQTTIQEFVKGKKDKRIPKTGYDGEEIDSDTRVWTADEGKIPCEGQQG